MPLLQATLRRWIPLAGLTTALCLLVHLAVQQMYRQTADDPQGQIAHDAARALAAGATPESVLPATPVEIGQSLAPFVTVLSEQGAIVASSARLHGEARTVPSGVLDHARRAGEERVTWQPEPGVRMATVVVHGAGAAGGFVVSGRSMRESEARTDQFFELVGLAWIATLVGLLVLVAGTELVFSRQRLV
jgi:hypothetical protein